MSFLSQLMSTSSNGSFWGPRRSSVESNTSLRESNNTNTSRHHSIVSPTSSHSSMEESLGGKLYYLDDEMDTMNDEKDQNIQNFFQRLNIQESYFDSNKSIEPSNNKSASKSMTSQLKLNLSIVKQSPIEPPSATSSTTASPSSSVASPLGKASFLTDMLAKRQRVSTTPATSANKSTALTEMLEKRSNTNSNKEDKQVKISTSVPLKEDPIYGKFFQLLKLGHPVAVVRHKMRQESLDVAILDYDPEKPLRDQQETDETDETEMTIEELVQPSQDTKENVKIEEKTLQNEPINKDTMQVNDPLAKFKQMLKLGLPRAVVEHKMTMEGVDISLFDTLVSGNANTNSITQEKTQEKSQQNENANTTTEAKKNPLDKFKQMLKLGLPRAVVEHKMTMEGVDISLFDTLVSGKTNTQEKSKDGPANQSTSSNTASLQQAHQEKYKKYFQMLKIGMPRPVVEHKIRSDGLDPSLLDGPSVSEKPAAADKPALPTVPSLKTLLNRPGIQRANSVRKKLHWEVKTIAPNMPNSSSFRATFSGVSNDNSLKKRSIWKKRSSMTTRATLFGSESCLLDDLDDLDADDNKRIALSNETKENLDRLFMKTVIEKNGLSRGNSNLGRPNQAKQPTLAPINLIDMKKSQNIAITLARVKLSFSGLKEEILAMNPTALSTAQIQSLMDMWPDANEMEAVRAFNGDMERLGTSEKFLVETRDIPNLREKLRCLLFKQEFPTRVHELRESIQLVIRGLHQVCSSKSLQNLFNYILQTGNYLNFGGDEERAANVCGFALNSLAKLQQTKSFEGGMTFLQYIVQSVERDLPEAIRFYEETSLISKCSKVSLPGIQAEYQSLVDGLKSIRKEAEFESERPGPMTKERQIAAKILHHFANEVQWEVDDLDRLREDLTRSKSQFLEYFEEENTEEDVDVLLTYVSDFIDAYQREQNIWDEKKQQIKLKTASSKAKSNSQPHDTTEHKVRFVTPSTDSGNSSSCA